MPEKFCASLDEAVADIPDGATLLVGGFGTAGQPMELLAAVARQGARDLTVVCNNGGTGEEGLALLMKLRRVRKLICSYPRGPQAYVFEELFRQGEIELECVPQGTVAERLRAAGAGLGGFFTPTAFGTALAEGKETRMIDGRGHVFEAPLPGDFALIKADCADDWGNLTYSKTARNFGPVMAMAAACTIAQVARRVPLGGIDPEQVVTPGIFVRRAVVVEAA
ncbi:3-oxoacid CoA-transferase subunit A [Pararoseomonas sp. SCSIO 73927]|uniref:3-oxoacid CoA-transferase subunit A n=1 Tax=Pararoseomonas sp. SCSIO 73927 TaxID=3114537 RepID=UPI0030D4F048